MGTFHSHPPGTRFPPAGLGVWSHEDLGGVALGWEGCGSPHTQAAGVVFGAKRRRRGQGLSEEQMPPEPFGTRQDPSPTPCTGAAGPSPSFRISMSDCQSPRYGLVHQSPSHTPASEAASQSGQVPGPRNASPSHRHPNRDPHLPAAFIGVTTWVGSMHGIHSGPGAGPEAPRMVRSRNRPWEPGTGVTGDEVTAMG